jgi:hypothetical protein
MRRHVQYGTGRFLEELEEEALKVSGLSVLHIVLILLFILQFAISSVK